MVKSEVRKGLYCLPRLNNYLVVGFLARQALISVRLERFFAHQKRLNVKQRESARFGVEGG